MPNGARGAPHERYRFANRTSRTIHPTGATLHGQREGRFRNLAWLHLDDVDVPKGLPFDFPATATLYCPGAVPI